MLASPVNVQEVNEVLPTLVEALDVRGQILRARELNVVVENLVLEPLQIEHGLALARVEALYHSVSLLAAKLCKALAVAPVNEPSIERACGHGREVRAFGHERRGERYR